MIFQCYRSRSCGPSFSGLSTRFRSVAPSSFFVPAAPARSDFSVAFDDVRRFRGLGFYCFVKCFNPQNPL